MTLYGLLCIVLAAVATILVVLPSIDLPITSEAGLGLVALAALVAGLKALEGVLPGLDVISLGGAGCVLTLVGMFARSAQSTHE